MTISAISIYSPSGKLEGVLKVALAFLARELTVHQRMGFSWASNPTFPSKQYETTNF